MPGDYVAENVNVDIHLEADTPTTPRITQVSGIFDVDPSTKNSSDWHHELPLAEKEWNVGLIVGPSGSGKSVLAREVWGERLKETADWDNNLSLIDNFDDDVETLEITSTLTNVGLGSVPAWLRPYSTLSNGERFRADMARFITETTEQGVAVVDEFTSVVDRQVAKVSSHCVQKTVRRQNKRFVAVTCHYDVIDWLQPDWVYDLATLTFSWRSVQPRPGITLDIRRASTKEWHLFAKHHYLDANISPAAQCFIAEVNGDPVAFTSYIHFPHPRVKNVKMLHRTVVLPDYQGFGIAGIFTEWLAQHLSDMGYRCRTVLAHPALVAQRQRSPRWAHKGRVKTVATTNKSINIESNMSSRRLAIHKFEYQPPRRAAGKKTRRARINSRRNIERRKQVKR